MWAWISLGGATREKARLSFALRGAYNIMAALIVTHNAAIAKVADRVVHIHDGEVVEK